MKSKMKEEKPNVKTATTTWETVKDVKVCGMNKATRSGVKVTILWTTYVLLGSITFIYLEQSTSVSSNERDHHHWARFKELAASGDAVDELMLLKEKLNELCSHPRINQTFGWVESRVRQHYGHGGKEHNNAKINKEAIEVADGWWQSIENDCSESLRIIDHVTETHYWTLVDAIYFTMTVVTTIGYGHISPRTRYGRLFCVLYSLVGVPLTCILMAKSSDMFSNKMLQLYTKAKKRHHQRSQKLLLYGVTWIYLTIGFIVFMFLPSVALSELEGWTYEDALYYTFITLSTIGFGDLVAGYNAPDWYSNTYKMCVVIWIMLALGYWFLLLNFLQKALKSNVPRKLKKTLSFRTKTMTKQAEFFRSLVGSVRNSQRKISVVEGEREVMALMVEVAEALTGDEANRSRRPSRPRSRKTSLKLDCTQLTEVDALEIDDDDEAPCLTLSDLLDVNITIKSEGVPTIRTFAAQSPQPIEEYSLSLSGILKREKRHDVESPEEGLVEINHHEEVTLPLREVLQLVTLIASVEDQVTAEGSNSNTSLQDELGSPTDTTSTITSSFDTRESAPLLKDIFTNRSRSHRLFGSNIKIHPKHHSVNPREENQCAETTNEQFEDYSEEEETDTEGEVASQIDLNNSRADDKDIENGDYYHRDKFGLVFKR